MEAVNALIICEPKTAAGLEQGKTGEMMFLLGDCVVALVEVTAPSKIYHFGPALQKKILCCFFFSECLIH